MRPWPAPLGQGKSPSIRQPSDGLMRTRLRRFPGVRDPKGALAVEWPSGIRPNGGDESTGFELRSGCGNRPLRERLSRCTSTHMASSYQSLPVELWLLICDIIRDEERAVHGKRLIGQSIHEDLPQFWPQRSATLFNFAMTNRYFRSAVYSEAFKSFTFRCFGDDVDGSLKTRIRSILDDEAMASSGYRCVKDVSVKVTTGRYGHKTPLQYVPYLHQLLQQLPNLVTLCLDNVILTDRMLDILPTLSIKNLFLLFCSVGSTRSPGSGWPRSGSGELQSLAVVGCATLVQDYWLWVKTILTSSVTDLYLNLHEDVKSVEWPSLPNLLSLGLVGCTGKINRVAASALFVYPDIERLKLRGQLEPHAEVPHLPQLRSFSCYTQDAAALLHCSPKVQDVTITNGFLDWHESWEEIKAAFHGRRDTVSDLKLGGVTYTALPAALECLRDTLQVLPHLEHVELPNVPVDSMSPVLHQLPRLQSLGYALGVPTIDEQMGYLEQLGSISSLKEVSFETMRRTGWRRVNREWSLLK